MGDGSPSVCWSSSGGANVETEVHKLAVCAFAEMSRHDTIKRGAASALGAAVTCETGASRRRSQALGNAPA